MPKKFTFIDVGLSRELKNWMYCKGDWRRYSTDAHKIAWGKFYQQTRKYLINLQKIKREQNGSRNLN